MKKLLKYFLCAAFSLLFFIAVFTTARGYTMYRDALDQQSLPDRVAEIRAKPNYLPLSELPQTYLDAVVAVEDQRFRQHAGIDPIAIGRAVWNNLASRSLKEGGSTITQQLAKNLYFTQEKSFIRKIAEVFMALNLERHYSKDRILELYVNSIYFGDGYYCVRSASLGYFGKEPRDMTAYECTLLAGIPNAPSVYSLSQNPDLARQRQQYVIRQMVDAGYLTAEDAAALTQPSS